MSFEFGVSVCFSLTKKNMVFGNYRGRGMPRMGPMGGPPRNFNGSPNMRGRGILRGIPPRGMGFR